MDSKMAMVLGLLYVVVSYVVGEDLGDRRHLHHHHHNGNDRHRNSRFSAERTSRQSVLTHFDGIREPNVQRSESDCGNRDISQCTELLEVLTRKDIGFAATQSELHNMCPVLLNGLQCIDNYTFRCLNPQHRQYFNELYAGTIRVIKDLCDSRSKYQQEYILHAPCMRRVHPKYNKCSEVYHQKTARLNEVNTAVVKLSESDRKRNVIILCCSFQEYLQCSERIVFETCGNETARFTKNFLNRMAGPIVQTKCSRYAPGSIGCLQAANDSPSVASSMLLRFALLALLTRLTLGRNTMYLDG